RLAERFTADRDDRPARYEVPAADARSRHRDFFELRSLGLRGARGESRWCGYWCHGGGQGGAWESVLPRAVRMHSAVPFARNVSRVSWVYWFVSGRHEGNGPKGSPPAPQAGARTISHEDAARKGNVSGANETCGRDHRGTCDRCAAASDRARGHL